MSSHPDLHPYRIEWQANRTTNWVPVTTSHSHENAIEVAEEHVRQYHGYCRVISQHVIHRCQ